MVVKRLTENGWTDTNWCCLTEAALYPSTDNKTLVCDQNYDYLICTFDTEPTIFRVTKSV